MRFASSIGVAALLAMIAVPVFAANEDGSAVAVLQDARTLVPVRTVTEWLGATVEWDGENDEITITRRNTTVNLRPDSTAALLDGEAIVLDEPPVLLAGVTYVPARFVVESFGASIDYDRRILTLTGSAASRQMQLRVAVRDGDWITYRGPWFDIDYPAGFRPAGYDHAPTADGYDEDGMRFISADRAVEFYVYSPLWSGEPAWPTVWRGETVLERTASTEGVDIEKKAFTWVTVQSPRDDYTRSWVEIHQPELNVKYYFGIRYDSMDAYDRWRDAYARFKDSLVQYAD
ncbi:MAG: copper amine oxidase N-terminal domain-containing protein [Armatimonadota bacterium]